MFTECGGSLTAPSGTLSPSYLEVMRLNLYRGIRRIIDCQWNVTVKPGRTIKFEFISINISNTNNMCSNYVMVIILAYFKFDFIYVYNSGEEFTSNNYVFPLHVDRPVTELALCLCLESTLVIYWDIKKYNIYVLSLDF